MHGVIEGLESRVFGKEHLKAQAVSKGEVVLSFRRAAREQRWFLIEGAICRASSRKCRVTMRMTWKRSATILALGK